MELYVCPVCNTHTRLKAIRGVNFCEEHQAIAEEVKTKLSHHLSPEVFAIHVIRAVHYGTSDIAEQQLAEVLEQAQPGTVVVVTYLDFSAFELKHLAKAQMAGYIEFVNADEATTIANVCSRGFWLTASRTFQLRLSNLNDVVKIWLQTYVGHAIEAIQIAENA
ncbi:MAG TPA: hypothetical protein VLI92_05300 [Candidatus Saccharimonadales bacterium]|nr:hypothetical protein [Candidatus Saccharimonadales bacterium]